MYCSYLDIRPSKNSSTQIDDQDAMLVGKNISIRYQTDLIGAPWNGEVLLPSYMIDYRIEKETE